MKRIVVLIDGTWNKEGTTGNTNVAALDSANRIAANAFIKAEAADGTAQRVHYHDGVDTEGDVFKRLLGGAIGFGLKQIISECYSFVVADYASSDEIYIFGFSRGAYAARALAGLIGASGIQREANTDTFEVAWQHYRVKPSVRQQPATAGSADRKAIADCQVLAVRQAFQRDARGEVHRRVGYGRLLWNPGRFRFGSAREIFHARRTRFPRQEFQRSCWRRTPRRRRGRASAPICPDVLDDRQGAAAEGPCGASVVRRRPLQCRRRLPRQRPFRSSPHMDDRAHAGAHRPGV
jgi:hypothetical protein